MSTHEVLLVIGGFITFAGVALTAVTASIGYRYRREITSVEKTYAEALEQGAKVKIVVDSPKQSQESHEKSLVGIGHS